jgi:hypothetical protein
MAWRSSNVAPAAFSSPVGTRVSGGGKVADFTPAEVRQLAWLRATRLAAEHLERAGLTANRVACQHLAYGLWLKATGRISEELD